MTLRVAALALALLAALGVPAAPAMADPPAGAPAGAQLAACRGALPVTVRLPTANARALERLGVVRAIAAGRVRDLHVRLERGGRMVAQGSRGGAFTGATAVRLRFVRHARPGSARLVVTGWRAGCAAKRTTRRAVALDARDLPVALSAADRDLGDGRFAVTLRRTGAQAVTDLRLRVLDASGATIAEHARDAPLGEPLRVDFAPRELPAAGRYGLLLTGSVRGERARAAAAAAILLGPGPPSAGDPAPPAMVQPGAAAVQQVAVSWTGGRWQGADSAGFALPGIGEGQLVCRPDTQWLRVFPADRSRDVAMLLWTSREWDGGGESTIREAQMTPFTGPDFNEGLNKFTPPEKHSRGTFEGIVGDGLPPAGTFGAGRSPTEVRLSWSWDFSDPAVARCDIAATFTSAGPGSAGQVARGLSLAYNGESGVPADTTVATAVAGLGVVRLRCDPRPDGVRRLVLEPQPPLPGLVLSTREGSDRVDRALGELPYVVELPNNGLVELATTSGAALRVLLASRWKVNDPDPAQNFCRLTGIAVAG